MSFREFIAYYYSITHKEFPKEDYRVGMRRFENGRTDQKHRRNNIATFYFSILLFVAFATVLFIKKEFLLGILACMGAVFSYFILVKVERFSILYYFICWIRHKDKTLPQPLINKLFESNLPHEHFVSSNNEVLVLELLSDKSLLKMKYLAFRKGQVGCLKISFGRKVTVRCKKQKCTINCKNKEYQELLKEIADIAIDFLKSIK